jgi:hypothetical protein
VNTQKILVVAGFAVAAISAHAQINLTSAGSFSQGGTFSGASVPTYTPGSSISSIVLGNGPIGAGGSLNQWWFSVTDTADITTVSYSITVNDVDANTQMTGLILAQSYNSATGVVGPQFYLIDPLFSNVETNPGWNPITDTLTITEDITGAFSTTAFFKGNIQFSEAVPEPTGVAALAVGALGLLIRRRRSK